MDPDSGKEVSLFHPRQHLWREHFIWSADRLHLIGLTPIGRATVETLELNRERAIRIRTADVAVGRHPPIDDPVQEKASKLKHLCDQSYLAYPLLKNQIYT